MIVFLQLSRSQNSGICTQISTLKHFSLTALLIITQHSCSPSSYGRTTYTKPDWDVRLFTTIPRGTDKWKSLMKERTAAERVNNRILNDYGIGITKQRGKKRIFFMTTIAAMNVHLDAQLAKLTADGLFDFQGTFGLASAA